MAWIKFEHPDRGGWVNLDNVAFVKMDKDELGKTLRLSFTDATTEDLLIRESESKGRFDQLMAFFEKEIEPFIKCTVKGELKIETMTKEE